MGTQVEEVLLSVGATKVARNAQAQLFSAENFKAKNVACVVADEDSFGSVMLDLENLGFQAACSSSLDITFGVVAEDPEEWAMIIIRVDQPIIEERIETYVRLIRMMDVRIPVMVMLTEQKSPGARTTHPASYADCVVEEPRSQEELSIALQIAHNANKIWGSKYGDVGRTAVNRLSKRTRRTE